MSPYRIVQNTKTEKYKIQVRWLIFFWSTLQWCPNGNNMNFMIDKLFDTYEEAEKKAEDYCKKYDGGEWLDATRTYEGVYRGGDSKGKQGTPPKNM